MKATKGGNCKGQSWLSCVNPSLTMLFLISRLRKRGLSSCLSMLMTVCVGLGTWPSSGQSLGLEKMGCRWFSEGCGGAFRQTAGCEASLHPSFPFPLSQHNPTELSGVQTANAELGLPPPGEMLPLSPERPQAVHSCCTLGSDQLHSLLDLCRARTSEASRYNG